MTNIDELPVMGLGACWEDIRIGILADIVMRRGFAVLFRSWLFPCRWVRKMPTARELTAVGSHLRQDEPCCLVLVVAGYVRA